MPLHLRELRKGTRFMLMRTGDMRPIPSSMNGLERRFRR